MCVRVTDALSATLLMANTDEPLIDTLYRVFLLESAIEEDVLFDKTPPKRRKTRSNLAVSAVELCRDAHCFENMKEYAEKYLASNIFPSAKREIEEMLMEVECDRPAQ